MKFDDLKSFYSFKVLMEERNIVLAAKKIGINKGGLSRRMRSLEDEAGCKLFIKTSTGLKPTEEGALLLSYAKKILAEQESLVKVFDSKRSDMKSLNILGTFGTTSLITVQKLHKFFLENKEYKFNILATEQNLEVESSASDISIRPHADYAPNLIQIPFVQYRFRLFCSKGYIREKGEPKEPKDLDNHRLIGFVGRSILGNVNALLHEAEGPSNPRSYFLTTNSSPTLLEAAKRGLGIICLSDTTEGLNEMGITNVLPSLSEMIQLSIVFRSEIKYNPIIKKLVAFVEGQKKN